MTLFYVLFFIQNIFVIFMILKIKRLKKDMENTKFDLDSTRFKVGKFYEILDSKIELVKIKSEMEK